MYNPTLNREGGLRVDLSGTWDLARPSPEDRQHLSCSCPPSRESDRPTAAGRLAIRTTMNHCADVLRRDRPMLERGPEQACPATRLTSEHLIYRTSRTSTRLYSRLQDENYPDVACRPNAYTLRNRVSDVRRRHSFPTFSEKT
ncbi:hypothetical protein Bbelb_056240 [Branchiostoma belcheri]|nr:hypothetical protein Bbelb_056240 [Branchiostoma belcheri]